MMRAQRDTNWRTRVEADTCWKASYPSEQWARKALISIERQRDFFGERVANRREQRVYECNRCHQWHLTSQPLKG